ncbi:MAG: hypothetical protein RIB59_12550 [Rhodospirillales bacterium]
MIPVTGQTCVDAWREGVKELVKENKRTSNLIIEIKEPTIFNSRWFDTYNPKNIKNKAENISDVSNTIFPQKTWDAIVRKNGSRQDLYHRYTEVYNRGKRIGINSARNKTAWGSYFLRLIDLGAEHSNQLEKAIECVSTWGKNHAGAITFHITTPGIDAYRPAGGPCWHFGELSVRKPNILDMTVVYRSHDYFNRTLGNFIGLARLLNFICMQTGLEAGTITCQSVYAWYTVSNKNMKELAQI